MADDVARSGAQACAGSSVASSCASRRATARARATSRAPPASSADLAESCVEAALRALGPQVPFAVIGMGRLGGHELSYASDIDVLFVYDGSTGADFDTAERTATALIGEIGATTAEGQTFRVDASLRPEGKKGPLARSLDGYRQLLRRTAAWCGSSSRSCGPASVAGDPDVGAALHGARSSRSCTATRSPTRTPARSAASRRASSGSASRRARTRSSTSSSARAGSPTSSSRCSSSSSQHGARHPEIRTPATIEALDRLHAAGLLDRGRRPAPGGVVPVLRAGTQRALPRHRTRRRRAPDRARRGAHRRAPRVRAPARERAARRVPARDPPGAARSSSACSTGRSNRPREASRPRPASTVLPL